MAPSNFFFAIFAAFCSILSALHFLEVARHRCRLEFVGGRALLFRFIKQHAHRLIVMNSLEGLGQERRDGEDLELGEHLLGRDRN